MQDRFKFRVWYSYGYPDKQHIMLYNAEQTYDFMRGEPEIIPAECFGELLEDNKSFTVMQCTGLKDKNGRLIYESDIVSDGYDKYVVEWSEYYIQFQFRDLSEEFKVVYTIEQLLPLEVVGNIYENGELLKC